ncbi:hypothetical protein THRCLA_20505 [Thraustotheca clavata]|uniref:Uncharacterized protein n=1 Tax=Thraustotheca clavata TaxID=74557 RepID=A0A1W0A6J8_9STRA|nr:hypothetical protein THRCLA_20505 [Thraustotheca clavata]
MSSNTITAPSFQKLWSFGNQSIEALFVHLLGRVFVNYNSSSNSSVDVLVSTDSQALLDLVYAEIVPRSFDLIIVNNRILPSKGKCQALNLTTLNPKVITQGNMLITLTVNKPVAMLWTMAAIVIDEGSLISNDESTKLHIRALDGGSIYYSVDKLKLKQLDWSMESFSNNTIAVLANEATTPKLHSSAFSNGAIYLESNERLEVKDSLVEAFSSGSIYYPHCDCATSEVSTFDHGIVNIASLICYKPSMTAFSNIQTTDSLSVSTFDEGLVNYFNSTPHHTTCLKSLTGAHFTPLKVQMFTKRTSTPTKLTIVSQVIDNSWFEAQATSVESFGAAFVIVAIVVFVLIRRGRRSQYKPLP